MQVTYSFLPSFHILLDGRLLDQHSNMSWIKTRDERLTLIFQKKKKMIIYTNILCSEQSIVFQNDQYKQYMILFLIFFVLFYFSYESEGSEVVPVTALRRSTTEWQKNSTKENSGESWCSPRLRSSVGLGPRILSLRLYDSNSFSIFLVQ